jgi:hypothetical protein
LPTVSGSDTIPEDERAVATVTKGYRAARAALADFVYERLPRVRLLTDALNEARHASAMARADVTTLNAQLKQAAANRSSLVAFSSAFPSHQAAVDLFTWHSAMPSGSGLQAGMAEHFADERVTWAASRLGGLASKTILELGPLEGYNTWQFESLGAASVLSIENNRDNFLKCLVLKNILGMRTTFLHGDMIRYLYESPSKWDLCWASGVLYHLTDPIRLLEGLANMSRVAFIWTHYFDKARADEPETRGYLDPSRNKVVDYCGRAITLHHRNYSQLLGPYFCGGDETFSYWMEKEDILHVLRCIGFRRIEMGIDNPQHPSGAACFFLAFAD